MFLTTFTQWFRSGPPPAPIACPDLLKNLDCIESFPPLSDTVIRAIGMANDPNCSLDELSELIRRDAIIATAMLKRANNWSFRGRNKVSDVQQATVRIGMRECIQVIAAVGMRSLYTQKDPKVHKACDVLMRHGLFTACVASAVNRALELGFKGEEFSAGLLHDVGRLIVVVRAPDMFPIADPMNFDEDTNVIFREREILGIDHCRLGFKFAEANRLPPSIASCIRNHHIPHAADKEHRRLVALISMADRIANHAQRTHRVRDYSIEGCPGFAMLSSGMDATKREAVRRHIHQAVVWSIKMTSSMLKFGE